MGYVFLALVLVALATLIAALWIVPQLTSMLGLNVPWPQAVESPWFKVIALTVASVLLAAAVLAMWRGAVLLGP